MINKVVSFFLIYSFFFLFKQILSAPFKTFDLQSDEENQEIQVKKGEQFRIQAICNPSTGFQWYIQYKPQKYIALLTNNEDNIADYIPNKQASNGMVGAPGICYFDFAVGQQKPSTPITFVLEYKRSWENYTAATIDLTIKIK